MPPDVVNVNHTWLGVKYFKKCTKSTLKHLKHSFELISQWGEGSCCKMEQLDSQSSPTTWLAVKSNNLIRSQEVNTVTFDFSTFFLYLPFLIPFLFLMDFFVLFVFFLAFSYVTLIRSAPFFPPERPLVNVRIYQDDILFLLKRKIVSVFFFPFRIDINVVTKPINQLTFSAFSRNNVVLANEMRDGDA